MDRIVRRRRKVRMLAALTAAMMVLCCDPSVAAAADNVNYIDGNGDARSVDGVTEILNANATALTSGWYVVGANVTYGSALEISGNVMLILADACTLNAGEGVHVASGSSLTVYGQSAAATMGKLIAVGADYAAGIGGDGIEGSCGDITINGGNIDAKGGWGAAGIGGGNNASGGNITINSGIVKANGGNNCAGIGGGSYGDGGNITINGGSVNASGSSNGAGIGGGFEAGGGNITINGGTVVAHGSYLGAAIGSSCYAPGGNITISGGVVTAYGKQLSAGIGSGAYGGNGGNIIISGGVVTAYGGPSGAGIGGGEHSSGGNITITGGTVNANGGAGGSGHGGGAGIGGGGNDGGAGDGGDGGTIIINGGVVTANGGNDGGAAGIGGGGGSDHPVRPGQQGDGGEFSMGGDGVVFASSVGDKTGKDSGILFDGSSGTVYGDVVLPNGLTVPTGTTLTVTGGAVLSIPEGVTLSLSEGAGLINHGVIHNSGTVENASGGAIENQGVIENASGGAIENQGVIENASGGAIENHGVIGNTSGGAIENQGVIENASGGAINSDGVIDNGGAIINRGEINGEVEGNQPDSVAGNNADISAAYLAVTSASYSGAQSDIPDILAAFEKVRSVIDGLTLNGVTATITGSEFVLPSAGTKDNPNGVDGKYTFTVKLDKGIGTQQTTALLTLTITATAYVADAPPPGDGPPPSYVPPLEGAAPPSGAGRVDLRNAVVKIADKQWTGKNVTGGLSVTATAGGSTYRLTPSDYVLAKAGRHYRNIGEARITVHARGDRFKGSKTVTFKIVPRKVSVKSLTAGKKSATVKWKKTAARQKITGYRIQYKPVNAAKWLRSGAASFRKASHVITGLKSGRIYEVRVRSYKSIGDTRYYGPWSKVMTSGKVK